MVVFFVLAVLLLLVESFLFSFCLLWSLFGGHGSTPGRSFGNEKKMQDMRQRNTIHF